MSGWVKMNWAYFGQVKHTTNTIGDESDVVLEMRMSCLFLQVALQETSKQQDLDSYTQSM